MEVGVVKVAEDSDFEKLKTLLSNHDGWKLDYSKGSSKVWTKGDNRSLFKMIKMKTVFLDISPGVLYDVLHDPHYRRIWDKHMLDASDIGCLNPNNDIGYYAMSCPPPLRNRDFVLQRSWLETGQEFFILNHSVYHKDYPPKKNFVRGISYLTGFVILPNGNSGCELGYVSHSNPGGTLPPWLVNKVAKVFAPKMIKRLQKACKGYLSWKQCHNPSLKPWLYPEQIELPRIRIDQCIKTAADERHEMIDESGLDESALKEVDLTDESDDL